MKSIFLFFAAWLSLATLSAQRFLWDGRFGGPAADVSADIALDASGNAWVAGYFADTVYFDLPSGLDSLMSAGGDEGFLLKYASNGTLLWAGVFSGPGEVRLWSVTADGNHVLVAGTFTETLDADPGAGETLLTSAGDRDIFVAKLSLEGQLVWVRQIGSSGWELVKKVTMDTNENILLAGSFPGTVDFDPGPDSFEMTSVGSNDAFVLKLDAGGNFLWANSIGGSGYDAGEALGTDAFGNIIFGGHFSGTADLDPGAEVDEFTSLSGFDIFLVKWDNTGQSIWLRHVGGQNDDVVNEVAVQADGGIYATGRFASNLIFDVDNSSLNLQSQGSTEAWVARMDEAGEVLWTKRIGGSGSDHGNAIAFDSQGGCFVAGLFSQTMSIGNASEGNTLTAQGGNDAFVVRLAQDGSLLWKRRAGANEEDFATALAVDAADNVLVTGVFEATVRFNPGNWNHKRESAGGRDMFIWKMGQCQPASGAASHISCGEVLNINGQSFTETGNYEQWIFTPQGCDSLVYLDLAFYPLNLTINLEDGVYSAAAGLDAYQWVNCSAGFVAIDGATGQTFTPEVPGSYAVTVFNGPCSETTECLTLLSTVDEVSEGHGIAVFPNPNNGKFNVVLSELSGRVSFFLTDISGRLIWSETTFGSENTKTVEHDLKPGVYNLKVVSPDKISDVKVVVVN